MDAPTVEPPSTAYALPCYLAAGVIAALSLTIAEFLRESELAIVLAVIAVGLALAAVVRQAVDRNMRQLVANGEQGGLTLAHVRYVMRTCDRIEEAQQRVRALAAQLVADAETQQKVGELEQSVGAIRQEMETVVQRARNEGYVDGVRNRLSGVGAAVIEMPARQ